MVDFRTVTVVVAVDDDRRRDSIDCRLIFNVEAQTLDDGTELDVVIIFDFSFDFMLLLKIRNFFQMIFDRLLVSSLKMLLVDDLSMKSAAVGVLVPFQFEKFIVFIFTNWLGNEFWRTI